MGPLFNGMTIASERNVWAAGIAARTHADRMPKEIPQNEDNGDDTCPTPTPTPKSPLPDDFEPTEPNKDQRDQIASSNSESGNNGDDQDVINAINKLTNSLSDLLNAEGEISSSDGYQQLKDLSNGVSDIASLASTILEGIEAAGEDATPIGILGSILLKLLGKDITDDIEKAINDAVAKWVDTELEELKETLEKKLGDDYAVFNCPHPAREEDTIGHAPSGGDFAVDMLAVALGAGETNYASKAVEGNIQEGSPNVFFGGKRAARVNNIVDCQQHAPSKIAQGSATVFVNGWPVARVGSKTNCNGVITSGDTTVFVDMGFSSTFKLNINGGVDQAMLDLTAVLTELFPPDKILEDGISSAVDDAAKGSSSDSDSDSSSDDSGSTDAGS